MNSRSVLRRGAAPLLGIGLALAAGPQALAQASRSSLPWDAALSFTDRFQEVELSYLPLLGDLHAPGPFRSMRLGVGLVRSSERDRENGLRLHLDLVDGARPWYVQAGGILASGQDLGVGLGLRVGAGYRFTPGFRAGLVADAVAGTHRNLGSVGMQAALTF